MTIKQQWLDALWELVNLYKEPQTTVKCTPCSLCRLALQLEPTGLRENVCIYCIYNILYQAGCDSTGYPLVPKLVDSSIMTDRKFSELCINRMKWLEGRVIPDTEAMDEKEFEDWYLDKEK